MCPFFIYREREIALLYEEEEEEIYMEKKL